MPLENIETPPASGSIPARTSPLASASASASAQVQAAVQNQAEYVFREAALHPSRPAIVLPKSWSPDGVASDSTLSFQELINTCQKFRSGLTKMGLKENDRVLILAQLQLDLYPLVIALIANGIIPVFLDPALDSGEMKKAVAQAKVKAVFSIHALFKFRFLMPKLWPLMARGRLISFDSSGLGLRSISELRNRGNLNLPAVVRSPHSTVLMTYTTGSSGRPKAANRTFEVISEQHLLSRKYWPEHAAEVDMPCFPMIAFQNLCCGITTVLPALNSRNPADFSPTVLIQQIRHYKVTRISASPAFMDRLTRFAVANDIQLPLVQSLVIGGAPISKKLAQRIETVFPKSKSYIVYGSTEVEPMSFTAITDYLTSESPGAKGYFVGKPLPELKVIVCNPLLQFSALTDQAKSQISRHALPPHQQGEILVSGPHVIKEYIENPEATAETKLKDGGGNIWHRTGDLGYLDTQGRIWLTGRVKDALIIEGAVEGTAEGKFVGNYSFEIPLEERDDIRRCAVVQRNNKMLYFLEPESGVPAPSAFDFKSALPESFQFIEQQTEYHYTEKLPVDSRHQWKIRRQDLHVK